MGSPRGPVQGMMVLRWSAAPLKRPTRCGDPIPNEQHDDRAQRRRDEPRALIRAIPSNSLPNERGDERASDPSAVVSRNPEGRLGRAPAASHNPRDEPDEG